MSNESPARTKAQYNSNVDNYSVSQRSSKPLVIGIFRFCRTPQNEKYLSSHSKRKNNWSFCFADIFCLRKKTKTLKTFFCPTQRATGKVKKLSSFFCALEVFAQEGRGFLSVRNWKLKTRKRSSSFVSALEIISQTMKWSPSKKLSHAKKWKWFFCPDKNKKLDLFVASCQRNFSVVRVSRNIFFVKRKLLPKTCQAKIVSRKKGCELLSNPDE